MKARLEDAQFFFNEDRKKSLEQHRDKLKTVVFQEGLGSIYEKTERLEKLATVIADILEVDSKDKKHAIRAAQLSKADLVTGMVTEFTELQGIMGREYAKLDGEDSAVFMAIDEHYMPRFAGDSQPKTTAGRIVSLADKIDNIVATFSRGLIPTGSQDPFALRRAKWSISINKIVDEAMTLLKITDEVGREKLQKDVADFMRLRIKNVLSDSVKYDVIDAVIEDVDDIYSVTLKAAALSDFVKTADSTKTIQSFVRVSNLAAKADSTDIKADLLNVDAEVTLYKAFEAIKVVAEELIGKNDYTGALEALQKLSMPINSFFDSVMVMDDDLKIRSNRLALLKSIDTLLSQVAAFGKIVL